MQHLRERVAVVTGAASGIGLAVTEAFLQERMRVAMADRNEEALQSHARRLLEGGGEVHAVTLDVTDPEAVERCAGTVVERFGALHVAVNNAGVVCRGLTWDLPLEDWHRVIDVDLWGVIHGVRAFVPRILATAEEGHVVNVASMAAVQPLDRLGPYTVAKHGVLGLTDVLRADFALIGAPVGASVVMPGMIRTGMNPFGTVEPSAVAANVVDAIRRNRPYVFTDDHSTQEVADRMRSITEARADVLP